VECCLFTLREKKREREEAEHQLSYKFVVSHLSGGYVDVQRFG